MRNSLSRRRAIGSLSALIGATVLGGCMHPGHFDKARTGPFYTPTNYVGDSTLGSVRRVVVLPVWSDASVSSETAAQVDPIIVAALQREKRFEIVSLSRETALRKFRAESFSSSAALPHDLLLTLQRDFAADAVLFVDITVYQAYRPLALGFRAKLAATDGSRLIWTFDEVFSSDDARVANGARNHFVDLDRRIPADLSHGVLHSPSRFAAYVSASMFSTLPPVMLAAPTIAATPAKD